MSCLYCAPGAARCDVCDPPPGAGGKLRLGPSLPATQRERARRGLHPLGDAFAVAGSPGAGHTCGDCVHLRRYARAKVWFKCALLTSGGLATDVRRAWPACAKWAPRVTTPEESPR